MNFSAPSLAAPAGGECQNAIGAANPASLRMALNTTAIAQRAKALANGGLMSSSRSRLYVSVFAAGLLDAIFPVKGMRMDNRFLPQDFLSIRPPLGHIMPMDNPS